MTKFVSLIEAKNADGFKTAVEETLAEKVSEVLDGLKPIVAQRFFSGISENSTADCGSPGPGVGQAPDDKGGFKAADDVEAGGDTKEKDGGFTASKLKKIFYRPAIGASQGFPKVAQ